MDALKEKLAIALSWFVVFWFVIFTIVSFPSFGTVIFLVGLAVCLPIPAIRDFWSAKGLRGAAKIALIAALVVAGAAMTPREKTEPSKEAETLSDVAVAEAQEPAPEENGVEAQEETQSETMPPDGAITLVAGEKGEYGKYTAMNDETFYAYYLPGGVYSVTNAGEYPAQVSVYEGIQRDFETGFDEYSATGDVLRLEVGESGEIAIPDGWFVEIHEPDKAAFVRIGDATEPEPEPAEETPEPAPELTGKEKVDADLRAIVSEKYRDTRVTGITLNDNLGSEAADDYVALIYLRWNVQNGPDMTKSIIAMYSEDFAARIGTDIPAVTDVAIFWTVPYHSEETAAKYSYERRSDGGMYKTDEVWTGVVR